MTDYMDLPCPVTPSLVARRPRRPMGRRPGTGGVLCIAEAQTWGLAKSSLYVADAIRTARRPEAAELEGGRR
jgi:hypothetical protein